MIRFRTNLISFDFKTLKIIESKHSVSDLKFPYMPGLLSYRESPALVDVYNELEHEPDIILIPAHGLLHSRKLGMASHVGLLLDKPTIGISKNLVCGEVINGKVYLDNELLGIELSENGPNVVMAVRDLIIKSHASIAA